MPGPRNFHPGEQMKVEIMAARIAPYDQHSSRKQGGAGDQKAGIMRRRPEDCVLASRHQSQSMRG